MSCNAMCVPIALISGYSGSASSASSCSSDRPLVDVIDPSVQHVGHCFIGVARVLLPFVAAAVPAASFPLPW